MPLPASHQILVAVEPAVLGDVIVELLRQSDVGDVVTVARGARDTVPGSRYDAAVVTGVLPGDVTVGVTIRLPDEHGGAGTGTLLEGGRTDPVAIATPVDVLNLFDLHCPAAALRASRLTAAFPPDGDVLGATIPKEEG